MAFRLSEKLRFGYQLATMQSSASNWQEHTSSGLHCEPAVHQAKLAFVFLAHGPKEEPMKIMKIRKVVAIALLGIGVGLAALPGYSAWKQCYTDGGFEQPTVGGLCSYVLTCK